MTQGKMSEQEYHTYRLPGKTHTQFVEELRENKDSPDGRADDLQRGHPWPWPAVEPGK